MVMRAPRILLAFLAALLSVLVLTSICGGVALLGELVLPDWILKFMLHMLVVPVLFVATGALFLKKKTTLRRTRLALVGVCVLLYAIGGYQLLEMLGLPGLAWPFAALPLLGLLRLTVELLHRVERPRRDVAPMRPMITLPRSYIVRVHQTAG